MQEELFAPVFTIYRTQSDEESLHIANNSQYGLGATVIGLVEARALELGQKILTGSVYVNSVVVSDSRLPNGGEKQSGFGRMCALQGIEEFANMQTFSQAKLHQ